MARKAKKVYKEGPFQKRLRIQFDKHCKSQDELADKLGVTRQTVGGWLNGVSIPDIDTLAEMAQLFGVSADYLLGLSDTESPDISVRAAVEYTGLTEEAVERLHNGLFDPAHNRGALFERKKKENLRTASALIQSDNFQKIIDDLNAVAKYAYMEKIMVFLVQRYFKTAAHVTNSKFFYTSDEERNIVVTNFVQVLKMSGTRLDRSIMKKAPEMNDTELIPHIYSTLTSIEHENAVHQFHAAKEFNRIIDQLVRYGRKKAEKRFPAEKPAPTEK